MSPETQPALAVIIFAATYAAIISERIHRTTAALAGAALLVLSGLLSQEEAFRAVDWNTIGLLLGMMTTVEIIKQTGIFEWLAIAAARLTRGNPALIMAALAVITAVVSAFLDNVTTVLLIVPVTLSITRVLEVNPVPFLISEIFASNIGGTATLIGDPPNIMIGGAIGFSFNDFIKFNTPAILIILPITVWLFHLVYHKDVKSKAPSRDRLQEFDPSDYLQDRTLLVRSSLILALMIGGFVLQRYLHLQAATIALAGAILLLLISRQPIGKVLREVEWPVILFFAGLFILVRGLEVYGVLRWIAKETLAVTGTNLFLTTMLTLWTSALLSSFIDNIPFVATMIPLIKTLGTLSGMDVGPLWWALSLGACLGGNGTVIGASANVVVTGIAAKMGHPISFRRYLKVGYPVMLVSILISTVYLWWRFF
ncbi:MAG: ArsB/NhaD family transporter [Syntrophomonadaceae bacterium]|nr:ArsB/NhaD family transporter [Syntrophomonadaceae bacterium]